MGRHVAAALGQLDAGQQLDVALHLAVAQAGRVPLGARALLVSHWAVRSRAAVALTTGVFDAQSTDPTIGRAEALRRSIRALIATGGDNAHPAVWAPFILVGDGT